VAAEEDDGKPFEKMERLVIQWDEQVVEDRRPGVMIARNPWQLGFGDQNK